MKIIFFGSTTDSILVLEKLSLPDIVAVVTQPPKPVGRAQILTPSPVEIWAKNHNIPAFSFTTQEKKPWLYADEQAVLDALRPLKADLLVSASYGQKIPSDTVSEARFGGLNVHPSLLPRWRGADPVPWAILSGNHQTGVTIVTLSPTFDAGRIIAQEKIPVTDKDSTIPLLEKIFTIGADLLITSLPDYISGKNKGVAQKIKNEPYARRLTRDDGFEPWENLTHPNEATRIDRKFRALHPWPGLWTRLPLLRSGVSGQATFRGKRLKILGFTTSPTIVQLEGKKPISWEQFKAAYLAS
jgi:methionyl-tRNA formyltransferase